MINRSMTTLQSIVVVLAGLTLFAVGGRWIGQEIRRGLREARSYGVGDGVSSYTRLPNVSDEINDHMDWLINGLVRSRQPWSMQDAGRLIALLDNPPSDEYMEGLMREDTTPNEAEWYLKYNLVMPAISERIRHNDPMELGVKETLSEKLVEQLDSSLVRAQLDAVRAVVNARLISIPIVRAKLVAIKLATGDKTLADTIQLQLEAYDFKEQLRREGKLHEHDVDILPD